MTPQFEFVLEGKGLHKIYTQGRWWQKRFSQHALRDVNLSLRTGCTVGVTGKSGSGKTTLAMCLVGLEQLDAGEIFVEGKNLASLGKRERSSARRDIQLIFQDSAGALNPRMSAAEIVEEPLLINAQHSRAERSALAEGVMLQVGISPLWKHRRPHEFSGGQRQRLAIARALVLKPKVLILDEVFVGLDLSVQGQIANLLLDLQRTHKLSYVCISHDFAFVSRIADEIAVMDNGRIVEQGRPDALLKSRIASGVPSLATREARKAFGACSGA
jgi:oligopeptide transport system ATP-binding protein